MGNQVRDGEEEADHDASEYLRTDHFTDGRYTADGVIGSDSAGTGK
jgi:hypothetical protein